MDPLCYIFMSPSSSPISPYDWPWVKVEMDWALLLLLLVEKRS